VSQPGTYQDAEETVEEEGLKQLLLDMLFPVESAHQQVGGSKPQEPAQPIPAHGEWSEVEKHQIRVPVDEEKFRHGHYLISLFRISLSRILNLDISNFDIKH